MRNLFRCAVVCILIVCHSDAVFCRDAAPPSLNRLTNVNRGLRETAQGERRAGGASLRHDLDSLFSDTAFSNATFGVAIQSLKTGEYLYRRNDTKSLMPASNMKLFTTAEALALLGPEFRYKTELLMSGVIQNHILSGNLFIRGAGDPTFGDSSQYFRRDTSVFSHWANIFRESGVRHIKGTIVVQDSCFTPEQYPDGWQLDDAPYYYATPITGFAYNENQVTLYILPGAHAGALPLVRYADSPYGVIVNHAITCPDTSANTIDAARELCSDTLLVTGTIPIGHTEVREQTSVEDPEAFAVRRFRSALEANGIKLSWQRAGTGRSKLFAEPEMVEVDSSPPLGEIVRAMNKESDNFDAECLFRTVAKKNGGEGSWTRGIEVMRKYLATIGIDTTRIQFTDGSGLSRMDLVTADDIVTLLRAMAANPKLDSAFYNSFPIMGVDGTLGNRLKGTPAQGNIHAKTGSMTGVRSISGYLTTRDGEPIAFSILANNYTASGSEIGKLEDEVLLKLVNFSKK